MSYPAEVLADGPVVYWRLGESAGLTAADASGHGHTGAFDNGVVLGVAGLVGDADTAVATTDGGLEGVLGNDSVVGATTLAAWSLEVVVEFASIGSNCELVNVFGAFDYFGMFMQFDSGIVEGLGPVATVTASVSVGVVYHLVLVYDGTNLRFYRNGRLVDSVLEVDAVLVDATHSFNVGNTPGGGSTTGATFDEAAFYTTALSAGRVVAHASAAGLLDPPVAAVSAEGLAHLGILNPASCNGLLTVNGVSMHTPAWCMVDLGDLWFPAKTRGSNVLIPGAVGRRAYPVRADETTYSLPMLISGVVDQLGGPYPDAMVGLERNLVELAAVFVPDPNVATVSASLTMPSGAVRTAEVQIVGVKLGKQVGPVVRAIVEMVVPAGSFV
jgi:hypothetical protein